MGVVVVVLGLVLGLAPARGLGLAVVVALALALALVVALVAIVTDMKPITVNDQLQEWARKWRAAALWSVAVAALALTYVFTTSGEMIMLRASNIELAQEIVRLQDEMDGLTLAVGAGNCIAYVPNSIVIARPGIGGIRCIRINVPELTER